MTYGIIALVTLIYTATQPQFHLWGSTPPLLLSMVLTALSLGQRRNGLAWLTGYAFLGWYQPIDWQSLLISLGVAGVTYVVLHRVIDQDNRTITSGVIAVSILVFLVGAYTGRGLDWRMIIGSFIVCYPGALAWVWYSQGTVKKAYV